MTEGSEKNGREALAERERPGMALPGGVAMTIVGVGLVLAIASYTPAGGAHLERPYRLTVQNLAFDGEPEPLAPPAAPVPVAAEGVAGSNEGGWAALICSYPWPCEEALRISDIESGGDAYAVNPSSGACGLFGLYPCACIEPECNVAAAFAKWVQTGSFYDHWYRWWN